MEERNPAEEIAPSFGPTGGGGKGKTCLVNLLKQGGKRERKEDGQGTGRAGPICQLFLFREKKKERGREHNPCSQGKGGGSKDDIVRGKG